MLVYPFFLSDAGSLVLLAQGFVRSQPDPSRVSKETWTKLQEVVGSALSDSSEVIAALVFLTIRGMGKLPFITDAVGARAGEEEEVEERMLRACRRATHLVPTFRELPEKSQESVKQMLYVSANFDFARFLQSECPPSALIVLQKLLRSFDRGRVKIYLVALMATSAAYGNLFGIGLGTKIYPGAISMAEVQAVTWNLGMRSLGCK